MKSLMRVVRIIEWISECSGKLVSFLILITMALIVCEVILRYIFHAPTLWNMEAVGWSFGILWVMAGAYACFAETHVKMEVFYVRFGPRGKAILDLISAPLFFVFIVAIVWHGWDVALTSIKISEHSSSMFTPPIYPVKIVIVIGGLLMFLQGVAKWIIDFHTAISGRKP